jgi:hypothetical protein
MDAGTWAAMGVLVVAVVALTALAPRLHRSHRERQFDGEAGGGLGGVGGGFDAVWRPTAEEAHANWAAQVELPAPAPNPGDKGRINDGRIVIHAPADPPSPH